MWEIILGQHLVQLTLFSILSKLFFVVICATFILANVGGDVCNLEPCRMGYLELAPWFLPRFPAEFFPHRGFFQAGFFWPPF